MNKIPVSKISRIREEFLAGTLKTAKLAAELHITRHTVARRVAKLKRLAAAFPDKLQDLSFNPPRQPRETTQLYRDLIGILPVLADRQRPVCMPKAFGRSTGKFTRRGMASSGLNTITGHGVHPTRYAASITGGSA